MEGNEEAKEDILLLKKLELKKDSHMQENIA